MAARAFISYSHVDVGLLDRLHKHLAQLQRDGTLSGWFDRDIKAGGRFDDEIKSELDQADIFLACASPDYLASTYCMDQELKTALERESRGELLVVPVIFEPCEWRETPLSHFKAVPRDGKAVSEYTNLNVAFLDIVSELRRLAAAAKSAVATKSAQSDERPAFEIASAGRYRIRKEFDALHKRDFGEQAFSDIYKFFQASAEELAAIPDIEARLAPVSGNSFSCTILNRGVQRGFTTLHVRHGGSFGEIDILYGERNSATTSNGGFGVISDGFDLFLSSSMFGYSQKDEKLTPRQAAQMLWDDLLSKVGIEYA